MARVANIEKESDKPATQVLPPILPSGFENTISPFHFRSDRSLPDNHIILKSAASLRDSVYKELKIAPPRGIIFVYIFGEKGSFDYYLRKRYPHLPSRRAFFMAQGRPGSREEDLVVLTWWSDKLEQDLRHELTHALVHSAIPAIPLWLDEGLAEYFELKDFPEISEERRVQALEDFSNANRPDMFRLEGLRDIQQMGRAEYREAWCWTRWMLKGPPHVRNTFMSYLSDLRNSQKVDLAHQIKQLDPDYKEKMILHTRQIVLK